MSPAAKSDRKKASAASPNGRANAQTMAASQREISVSEFFSRNRHLLDFDNPRRALLTAIKEAVDNSLDACEEAGIMPEVVVHIEQCGPYQRVFLRAQSAFFGRDAGGHRTIQSADPQIDGCGHKTNRRCFEERSVCTAL
jgi:hypothetical protein